MSWWEPTTVDPWSGLPVANRLERGDHSCLPDE
jgi:hypothetical protein